MSLFELDLYCFAHLNSPLSLSALTVISLNTDETLRLNLTS